MPRPSAARDWLVVDTAPGLLAVLFPDHRTPETWAVRRKLRLVLCGAARTIWDRLPDDLRTAVEVAERFADGRASKSQLDDARRLAVRVQSAARAELQVHRTDDPAGLVRFAAAWQSATTAAFVEDCCQRSVTVARIATRVLAEFPRLAAPPTAWQAAVTQGWDGYLPDPAAAVVRDVFGPPDAPSLADWRSADVAALAEGIAADAAFDRLPVLADALEDAGCADERVLAHCRGPGPHWRGCWVVDSVLSAE